MKTEMQQYQNDAMRSLSTQDNLAKVSKDKLIFTLQQIKKYCDDLDLMKKQIFYGKEVGYETTPWSTKVNLDMLHALIGIVGESGELAGELAEAIEQDRELDSVNIIEEIGDQFWYDALALNTLGTTFEAVAEININKLKKRYPDKFTSEAALNRDLEAERAILEEGAGC